MPRADDLRRRLARLSDTLALMRDPVARRELASWRTAGLRWPLLSRLASLHRRTLASRARLVAVVGSYGKSTTVRAVRAVLGLPITDYYQYNARTLLAKVLLQVRPGDRHAVVEVGIQRPGMMSIYAPMVRPDLVVVTSIGSEHHRSLGSLERTRAEKLAMVAALPPDGLGLFNADDPNVRWMMGQNRRRSVTFGFDASADVRASDVKLDWPHGTRLRIHTAQGSRAIRVRLVGRHQLYPLLAAAGVGLAEGIGLATVVTRLEALAPTPARLEPVTLANGAILLRDDYKSSLETIDAALDLLAEVPVERRLVLLGEVSEPPGSQGPIYRRLGQRVGAVAQAAVFYGGNFQRYAAGAARAAMPRTAITDAGRSVRQAVVILRDQLGPGDVLLIKGRDHERLGRVALALAGRGVACDLPLCDFSPTLPCERCPMLSRGWRG